MENVGKKLVEGGKISSFPSRAPNENQLGQRSGISGFSPLPRRVVERRTSTDSISDCPFGLVGPARESAGGRERVILKWKRGTVRFP